MNRRMFLSGAALAQALPAQVPQPKSEFDYVDWSWERWREITRESRPNVESDQTGKAELVPLLREGANRVTTAREWNAHRDEIRRVFDVFLGEPPSQRPSLDAQIVEESEQPAYIRTKLTYVTEPGERVPAYLLRPKRGTGLKFASVLCPHQTTQAGMRESAGLAGAPQQSLAVRLAERGYVTFTWDALGFGERHNPATGHYGEAIPFYRRRPRWSLLGKMIWDLSRGLDYLESLDYVDARRIGCAGHSHGGLTTLFGMMLDSRIQAGVSSCGFDTFRIDGNTWRWSRATALLPRLGFYISSPYLSMDFYRAVPDSEVIRTPFDLHQVLAFIAPRPVFFSASDRDFVFPNGGWSTRQAIGRAEPAYSLLGGEGRLAARYFKGGHDFPLEAQEQAFAWLDRYLRPRAE
ncbi:MAG: alpha/beta hydrolase family protein [Bryobacteraceae bacterium]